MHQQEYYLVTDELKCHNLCSKCLPFSLLQMWIRMSHPQHLSCCNIRPISNQWWSNL